MADVYGAFGVSSTEISTMIDERYKLRPAKKQFTRKGMTSRWFPKRGEVMEGDIFHFKAFLNPATGARREVISTAAGTAGEFPRARDVAYKDLEVPWSSLREFYATININDHAVERTKSKTHAITNIAKKIIAQGEEDLGALVNMSIHQGTDAEMATIEAVYKYDGDTYPGGSATVAYLKITGGSISQFQRGQILDIRDTGSSVNVQITCTVNAVVYGNDGPQLGSSRVADIGPGIIVTYYSTEGTGDDTDFDNVEVNVNDSSHTCGIVLSGEGNVNITGWPSWFSETTDVYRTAGSGITRTGVDEAWSIPEIKDYTSSSVPVALDMDTHFGELADILPHRITTGRQRRSDDASDGQSIRKYLVAVTTPRIANYAVDEAKDTQRFTTVAPSDMSAAQRQDIYGNVGFDGIVWRSPTLGTIVLQPDELARANKMTVIEPNSWFTVNYAGLGPGNIRWLDMGGGDRLGRKLSLNTRPTHYRQGGAWTALQLVCDQMGVNFEIQGVKSGRY